MSQLTIYLEESTLKKIEHYSNMENLSISKWVKKCVLKALDDKLQPAYFKVFGALSDEDDFNAPPQGEFLQDAKRENF